MTATIEIGAENGVHTLRVRGDLDLASAPALRRRLQALPHDRARAVRVELHGVGFIDSAGLGVLVGELRRCRQHDLPLVLVGLAPALRSVFELTGLASIFTIESPGDADDGAAR